MNDEFTSDERKLATSMKRALDVNPWGAGFKVLFRMSGGNKAKAISQLKEMLKHYIKEEFYKIRIEMESFEFVFDWVLAEEFGDGCEVEWAS